MPWGKLLFLVQLSLGTSITGESHCYGKLLLGKTIAGENSCSKNKAKIEDKIKDGVFEMVESMMVENCFKYGMLNKSRPQLMEDGQQQRMSIVIQRLISML